MFVVEAIDAGTRDEQQVVDERVSIAASASSFAAAAQRQGLRMDPQTLQFWLGFLEQTWVVDC